MSLQRSARKCHLTVKFWTISQLSGNILAHYSTISNFADPRFQLSAKKTSFHSLQLKFWLILRYLKPSFNNPWFKVRVFNEWNAAPLEHKLFEHWPTLIRENMWIILKNSRMQKVSILSPFVHWWKCMYSLPLLKQDDGARTAQNWAFSHLQPITIFSNLLDQIFDSVIFVAW